MMDSLYMPLGKSSVADPPTDPELENKVKKASEKIAENLHIFSNEPSLACYRLQEHVHKSLPQLVVKRIEVNQLNRELQGKCYDLEYAVNAVKDMEKGHEHFVNISQLLLKSIELKQRLNSEEGKKTESRKKPSMYQRFSGSFDLPASILPTGLSSSVSVSADLKSTASQPIARQNSPSNAGDRRSRASSVSLASSRPGLTRQQSASCSPAKTK